MKLLGKTAVITGGSKGIGRAISLKFANEGARLVINYFDDDGESNNDANKTLDLINKDGGKAIGFCGDISKKDVVEEMLKATINEYGGVDILVCNAGICPFEEFLNISESLWDRVNDVNLKGAFLCSQAYSKQMIKEGKGGRILFTSSISAIF